MSADGLRVLAAARHSPDGWRPLGLAGLADPPRPEAAAMIGAFQAAGVRPVMITGDRAGTAQRVAETVGIESADVYARVRPEQKAALVAGLRSTGEVVAMTGDGVNDAPALRCADIGVAMGRRGTEVAKQAADLVLVGDDLSALVPAIAEGRRAYDNVRRFLRYAVSGGLAEVLVMLAGPALGFATPLRPAQILWVNLLTHGLPGVAMGGEPAEGDVLHRPPRPPGDRLMDRRTIALIAAYSGLVALTSLAVALWADGTGRPWQSCLFVTLTFDQLALALLLRPRWRQAGNPALPAAVALNVGLVLAAVLWSPLRELLDTQALSAVDLAGCAAATVTFALLAIPLRRAGATTTRR